VVSVCEGSLHKMLTIPRLISKAEAATYCGLSLSSFSNWQKQGIVPGPVRGTHRWDRIALDNALDKMSGIRREIPVEQLSPYDQWKAKQA
jgi:hypothetical protein